MSKTVENSCPKSHLVFRSHQASVHQSDRSELFILECFGHCVEFRFCEFLSFKKKIQSLDMVSLLSSDSPDSELIFIPHCQRYLLFNIHELLELRELLSGTMAMLELNSLIHSQLKRKVFN